MNSTRPEFARSNCVYGVTFAAVRLNRKDSHADEIASGELHERGIACGARCLGKLPRFVGGQQLGLDLLPSISMANFLICAPGTGKETPRSAGDWDCKTLLDLDGNLVTDEMPVLWKASSSDANA